MTNLSNEEIEVIKKKYLDKRVSFKDEDTDEITTGTVVSVNSDGELKIESDNGERYTGLPEDIEILNNEEDILKMTRFSREEPQHESLILSNQIVRDLRQMTSISEVKDIMNQAKALGIYFRQQNESLDIQIRAAETHLVALRRMGHLLIEMAETGEREIRGGDRKSNLQKVSLVKLKDLGISEKLSFESQKIASIPEKEFYKKIDDAKKTPRPPTKSSLLSLADKLEGKKTNMKRKRHLVNPDPEEKENTNILNFDADSNTEISREDMFIRILSEIEKNAINLYDNFDELLTIKEETNNDIFIQKFKNYQ